jgi:hypothetical protein
MGRQGRFLVMAALFLWSGCAPSRPPVPPPPTPPPPIEQDPVARRPDDFLDFILPDGGQRGEFFRVRLAQGSSVERGLAYLDKGPASGWPWGFAWTKIRWDATDVYLVEERAEVAFSMSNSVVFKRWWTPKDGPEDGAWKSVGLITWFVPGTCNVQAAGTQPTYAKLVSVGPLRDRPEVAVVEQQYGKVQVEVSYFTRKEGGFAWERHDTGPRKSDAPLTHPPCTPDVF